MIDKHSSLKFGGICSKGERESGVYVPINSSEEARICLECPLPADKCNPSKCKRYEEEKKKLLVGGNK